MRFTFKIEDSKSPGYDPVVLELNDHAEVRVEAVSVLTGMAKDAFSDGDSRDFTVDVTDEDGNAVFEAQLSFRSRWLDQG
jgi:hypothetical protein